MKTWHAVIMILLSAGLVLSLMGCVKVDKTNYVEGQFVVYPHPDGQMEVCGMIIVVINHVTESESYCQTFKKDKIPQISVRWHG